MTPPDDNDGFERLPEDELPEYKLPPDEDIVLGGDDDEEDPESIREDTAESVDDVVGFDGVETGPYEEELLGEPSSTDAEGVASYTETIDVPPSTEGRPERRRTTTPRAMGKNKMENAWYTMRKGAYENSVGRPIWATTRGVASTVTGSYIGVGTVGRIANLGSWVGTKFGSLLGAGATLAATPALIGYRLAKAGYHYKWKKNSVEEECANVANSYFASETDDFDSTAEDKMQEALEESLADPKEIFSESDMLLMNALAKAGSTPWEIPHLCWDQAHAKDCFKKLVAMSRLASSPDYPNIVGYDENEIKELIRRMNRLSAEELGALEELERMTMEERDNSIKDIMDVCVSYGRATRIAQNSRGRLEETGLAASSMIVGSGNLALAGFPPAWAAAPLLGLAGYGGWRLIDRNNKNNQMPFAVTPRKDGKGVELRHQKYDTPLPPTETYGYTSTFHQPNLLDTFKEIGDVNEEEERKRVEILVNKIQYPTQLANFKPVSEEALSEVWAPFAQMQMGEQKLPAPKVDKKAVSAKEREINRLEAKQRTLESQIAGVTQRGRDVAALEKEKRGLESELSKKPSRVIELEGQKSGIDGDIDDAERELRELMDASEVDLIRTSALREKLGRLETRRREIERQINATETGHKEDIDRRIVAVNERIATAESVGDVASLRVQIEELEKQIAEKQEEAEELRNPEQPDEKYGGQNAGEDTEICKAFAIAVNQRFKKSQESGDVKVKWLKKAGINLPKNEAFQAGVTVAPVAAIGGGVAASTAFVAAPITAATAVVSTTAAPFAPAIAGGIVGGYLGWKLYKVIRTLRSSPSSK
jgi:hypothetical protein